MTMRIHCDRCGRSAPRDQVKSAEYRTLSIGFSGVQRATYDLCETCVEAVGDPVPAIVEAMRLPAAPEKTREEQVGDIVPPLLEAMRLPPAPATGEVPT